MWTPASKRKCVICGTSAHVCIALRHAMEEDARVTQRRRRAKMHCINPNMSHTPAFCTSSLPFLLFTQLRFLPPLYHTSIPLHPKICLYHSFLIFRVEGFTSDCLLQAAVSTAIKNRSQVHIKYSAEAGNLKGPGAASQFLTTSCPG